MEMHQIRYFLAVADTLNFTRAAEQCRVTQPALSRAIKQLEDEVGGALLRRERATTHLTDLGRLMRPYLEQILGQSEAAKATAESFLKPADQPLRLGVMCTIGPLRFTGFLGRFRRDNPGRKLDVTEGRPAELAALLDSGAIDAAVMADPEGFPERFRVRPLYRERLMCAMPAGHRLAAGKTVRQRDLDGEAYISRASCEMAASMRKRAIEMGIAVRLMHRSEREDWVQSLVIAGVGVASLPEFSPMMPGLVLRPYVEPDYVREVSIVTLARAAEAPAVAAFAAALERHRWT
jgi:DNA-binding transcriptional LysR family regulator